MNEPVSLLRQAEEAVKVLPPGVRELADATVALAREWGWDLIPDDTVGRLNTEAQVALRAVLALAEQQPTRSDDVRAVLEYVSRGRRYVDVEPYPDFQARRALGALMDEEDVRTWHVGDDPGDDRALMVDAAEYVIKGRLAAVTAVQRNLRVGFAKAARLMDLLESWGIVGPVDGSRARKVLVAKEQCAEIVAVIRGGSA